MNIAFVCTGEFEPFFYECIVKNKFNLDINPFYVAFFADTRAAIKKIKQKTYPETIDIKYQPENKSKNCLLNQQELEAAVRYDYLRLISERNKNIKQRLINRAAAYEQFFFKFYRDNKIEAVVLWNYFPVIVNIAWQVARKVNLKTVFFENGPFPETLMIDSQGVNFQSSLTLRGREFFENQKQSVNNRKKHFVDYSGKIMARRQKNKGIRSSLVKFYYALVMRNKIYRNAFPDLTDDKIRVSLWKKIFSKVLFSGNKRLPKRFVFIPFQYSHDTQVLINSPLASNMELLLDFSYAALKEVDSTCQIVVKEHPDDFGRKDYKRLRRKYPNIIWLAKYDIQELIRKAQAVITINSSVGVAALTEHKPVITLGESFYNVDGIVYHVENFSELKKAIKNALTGFVNSGLIDKFIYYLRFEYLSEGSPRHCTVESLAGARRKLETILMEKSNE